MPPVILSAHFDHLGSDLAGNVYFGSLDNASGTAFLMQMAKYIESIGQPERDIIFIGFNAEEFGCLGSKQFVEKNKNKLAGSKVFNFDMIGSDKGIPLCIMGSERDTADTSLIKSVAAVCLDERIHFNYLFKDSSDHEYFRKNGIDAVTFCDNDMSRIHTPKDTAEYLSSSAVVRCFNVVSKQVIKYGFNNNIFILYNNEIFMVSFIGLASITILAVLYKIYNKKH
jgi:Predicted aminopeptidases